MVHLIRGFKDILPNEVEIWQHIEKTVKMIFEDFGFSEIRLPILERTELFSRSIGEDTDIVEKEMYTFADRKGDLITLRPEATASAVRSYIQHKLYAVDPIQKFYTIGPMFRRERPQKGRYRQFYQINAEVFGVESPFIDAQLIYMLMLLFSKLSVDDISPHINSLGCLACRPKFKEALVTFLSGKTDQLCSDCKRRKDKNPLRVLDCKVSSCQEALEGAPATLDHLCDGCREHFEKVKDLLEKLKVEFVVNKRLVRGLDYYTRTTFEIQTGSLGAQSAVAGGGRYDNLVKILGGPDTPAIGFAIGLDRLVEITNLKKDVYEKRLNVFIATLGENSREMAFEWACDLGSSEMSVEIDFSNRGLKGLMKRADRLKAEYVLIVGDKELEEGSAVLRNMKTKEQVSVPVEGIVDSVRKIVL
ncbi:MAG: histidine--tRNA ligase [Deltaproteobacteria bacterium]|nr:histidine--tRNA ligase [Deltaproteobacteria bacterium]MBW2364101.1 histidine--tRNA ligase [Deltaproteobacteria bacterium]